MSEKQETVHVVQRERLSLRGAIDGKQAVKVYDDREDAREYAKRMNQRSRKFQYTVDSCKKG